MAGCEQNNPAASHHKFAFFFFFRLSTFLPPSLPHSLFFFSCALRDLGWEGSVSCVGTVRRWGGGRVEVDFFFFPALLCESQGMVTINILYSLKPSKNTIFWRGAGYDGGGGGAVRSLPRPLFLGVHKQAVLCRVPLIFTYL